ncbi:MAG TPA: hypothetical protein VJT31_42210 [Rugosimonospora sp.]|nr:hypothetical protein [Rugosimonospora sp.]
MKPTQSDPADLVVAAVPDPVSDPVLTVTPGAVAAPEPAPGPAPEPEPVGTTEWVPAAAGSALPGEIVVLDLDHPPARHSLGEKRGVGAKYGFRKRKARDGKDKSGGAVLFYLLVAAVPMVLVLVVVGFSALPPYTPSQARAQPYAATQPTGTTPPYGRALVPPAGLPRRPAGAVPVVSYEAEDAQNNTLGTATRVRRVAGASGGLVVTQTGHGSPAGDVTFRSVVVPTTGRYVVTVYYYITDGATHRLTMSVNDGTGKVVTFLAARTATTMGYQRVTVRLVAGANALRFGNAGTAYGPNLDRITVRGS